MGLTGTCSEIARPPIEAALAAGNPSRVLVHNRSTVGRDNLRLNVHPKRGKKKDLDFVLEQIKRAPDRRHIVYVLSPRCAVSVTAKLIKHGVKAASYYSFKDDEVEKGKRFTKESLKSAVRGELAAGLDKEEVLRRFMSPVSDDDCLPVIVATTSFGLGIDSDVYGVLSRPRSHTRTHTHTNIQHTTTHNNTHNNT